MGILFVLAGIAGGVDFYMWEYDYGHNLNPSSDKNSRYDLPAADNRLQTASEFCGTLIS
jgi:hypothetical protein